MSRPTGRDADPRRTIPLNSSRWRKLRAVVLAGDPLCRDCGDLATDVDHDNGNPGDNSPDNLVPRCHSCHSIKTGIERAGGDYHARGCDRDGFPLAWRKNRQQGGSERPPAKSSFIANGADE